MAKATGIPWLAGGERSTEGERFWSENGDKLVALGKVVDDAFKAHDGPTILFMDLALRWLLNHILEGMKTHGVRFEVDSSGDEDDSAES